MPRQLREPAAPVRGAWVSHHHGHPDGAAAAGSRSAERLTGSRLDVRSLKTPSGDPASTQEALLLPPPWDLRFRQVGLALRGRAHIKGEPAGPSSHRWGDA